MPSEVFGLAVYRQMCKMCIFYVRYREIIES